MKKINIKRIYEEPSESDGYRILVDRLWPRGVTKIKAKINEWNKEFAPSIALRKWFAHKEEHFKMFAKLYKKELHENERELERIRKISKTQAVTLLYGAKDPKINHAVILKNVLLS
jgi:uncharacterized protein YeaO (DUF488 family)